MPQNDFKLTFTLKQHTPIIHFQYDQKGATLRATELKPKLDRFLIEKFKKDGIDYKSFLIAGQNGALDYKVRVEPNNTQVFPIEYHKKKRDENNQYVAHYNRDGSKVTITLPTFFANMGDDWKKNPKELILSNTLKIVITSFDSVLLKKIESNFQEFIFITTFGMRQSKGFGSFTLEKINDKTVEFQEYGSYKININIAQSKNDHIKQKRNKYVEEPDNIFVEYFELFEYIHRFHQTIRSGINERLYFKSWIFYYAMSKNVQWDKKTLKQKFLTNNCIQDQIDNHNIQNDEPLAYNSDKKYLVRDLLGLSTEQVWRARPKYSRNCYYGFTVRHPKERNGRGTDSFDNKIIAPNEVKRFKSPITYKPIKLDDDKYCIYIILHPIPQELKNKRFTILKEKNNSIEAKIDDMQLWEDFDLEKFFNYICDNKSDIGEKIVNGGNNRGLTDKITTIYNNLERIKNATN